jgi:hypothetical protein
MPLAREAVQRRLLALQEKSVEVAESLLMYAEDEKVRVAVMVAIWDRTGLGPRSIVAVESQREDLSTLTDSEILARAESATQRLKLMQASEQATTRMNEDDAVTPVARTH